MAKLRVLSGSQIRAILEDHGFVEVRQSGSHIIMQQTTDAAVITVPVPNHKEVRKGTLASIIRQSGIDRREFES